MSASRVMYDIERVLPEGGQWCNLDKAQTLAAIVIGLRPRMIVEIGVWMGGSLIPMLLALQYNKQAFGVQGSAIAIDPWAPDASIQGQAEPDRKWWGSANHDAAHAAFVARLSRHDLQPYCVIDRQPSQTANVPRAIDLLHVDGNHADAAYHDVERFAPSVNKGGILVLDDVEWTGGHVKRARMLALELGFEDLYPLGTGLVMQNVRGA